MTKKTRRILFYAAMLVFLFASYITVLYAQGYKYSFTEHKFLRTGAISLKANTDAKVFLDDTLVGTTSFIGNTFGINRLLPDQYSVRLQKDGFSGWQKNIPVTEGLVSDFPRIILLPQDENEVARIADEIKTSFASSDVILESTPIPTPRRAISPSPSPSGQFSLFFIKDKQLYDNRGESPKPIAASVLGYSLSHNQRKLMWWTNNEIHVMWLADTDYQPFHVKGDMELVTRFSSPILRAAWFRGEDYVAIESAGYKIVEIDTRGGINIIKL